MNQNQKPILEVSGLHIKRGRTIILQDISWRVSKGEHWVILGANGSGKTSLLRALTGYLTPTAGEIKVLGQQYGQTDWRDLRKHIGLVSSSISQMVTEAEPALETIISGKYAMINFWGKITKADRAKGKYILKQIECEYLMDRPWAFLSQGERQRLLIGRALMTNPQILILDEPCAGLDPVAREHFLQFLERLGKRNNTPTLVLVTHHLEEIMPRFSHAMILKDGQTLALGKKDSILTQKLLSKAFGASMQLKKSNGRYQSMVKPTAAVII